MRSLRNRITFTQTGIVPNKPNLESTPIQQEIKINNMYGDIKTAKERLSKGSRLKGIFSRRASGGKTKALENAKKPHVMSKEHHKMKRSLKKYMDDDSNFKD